MFARKVCIDVFLIVVVASVIFGPIHDTAFSYKTHHLITALSKLLERVCEVSSCAFAVLGNSIGPAVS